MSVVGPFGQSELVPNSSLATSAPPISTGITLLYGHPLAREVGFYTIAAPLLDGERAVVLDGANEFNAYIFSDVARRAGVPVQQLTSRVLISRVFTCHQLASLIIERTRPTLERHRSHLLVVLDLLTTFYDREVPRWEAERLLRRPLQCLRWLGNHGYHVLLLCAHEPHPNDRRAFFEQLKVMSDHVLRVAEAEGEVNVMAEKPCTGEQWQLELEAAFTRRRQHQPLMRWQEK